MEKRIILDLSKVIDNKLKIIILLGTFIVLFSFHSVDAGCLYKTLNYDQWDGIFHCYEFTEDPDNWLYSANKCTRSYYCHGGGCEASCEGALIINSTEKDKGKIYLDGDLHPVFDAGEEAVILDTCAGFWPTECKSQKVGKAKYDPVADEWVSCDGASPDEVYASGGAAGSLCIDVTVNGCGDPVKNKRDATRKGVCTALCDPSVGDCDGKAAGKECKYGFRIIRNDSCKFLWPGDPYSHPFLPFCPIYYNTGVSIDCSDCDNIQKQCDNVTCGADDACDGKQQGHPCDASPFFAGEQGICNITCQCELTKECPTCMADCDGDYATNGCEVNICTNASNCGGCGNDCSDPLSTTNINNSHPVCVNGWCDCAKDYERYGKCIPTQQISYTAPSCIDGSEWNSCNSVGIRSYKTVSLWAPHPGDGVNRAQDICDLSQVEYIAKKTSEYDEDVGRNVSKYIVYSCNYTETPFADNFLLNDYGSSYIIYPEINLGPIIAGGSIDRDFDVKLFEGVNLIGWPNSTDVSAYETFDKYLLEGRYEWICGK